MITNDIQYIRFEFIDYHGENRVHEYRYNAVPTTGTWMIKEGLMFVDIEISYSKKRFFRKPLIIKRIHTISEEDIIFDTLIMGNSNLNKREF